MNTNKQIIKEKKLAVLKTIMVYKVQLKVNKNLDRKLLGRMRALIRDLTIGKVDIDEKLAKIHAVIFNKTATEEDVKNEDKEEKEMKNKKKKEVKKDD